MGFNFKNIEFAYPWVFLLLLIVPLVLLLYIKNNKRQRASILITSTQLLKEKGLSSFHFPFILRCLSLILLIIALARPQQKSSETFLEGDAIDIMLCFDISWSMVDTTMIEKGFEPNRFTVSKDIASEFVRRRPGDRIGIVFFSSHGFSACPLTTDTNAVLYQIKNLEPNLLSEEGTSIGSGIATCVNRLRHSGTKSKIVLLLSDGVDLDGIVSPDTAVLIAKHYGIKIYSIGIGSEKTVSAKRLTPFGNEQEYLKSLEFNEPLLKFISKETGGEYFHAYDKEALQKSYETINSLEKSKIKTAISNKFEDKYLQLLILAFLILIIEVVLKYSIFKKFP
jgi:Ca-activated chloride channel family protein